jgi:hypothetical protein
MLNHIHTKTSENKNSNAKPTEIENGSTMPPPTPGHVLSRDTIEKYDRSNDLSVAFNVK